jgi:hypothetical protein
MRSKSALLLIPAALAAGVYALLVRGALTIDLGVGRRMRALGPVRVDIAAPREVVFDVVAAPYLGRTPAAMKDKLEVIERGADTVLAAHYTHVGPMTTVTLEVVSFERPERVRFRLVRGPVPHVTEEFALQEGTEGGTELVYTGEMGTDLWGLGSWWAARVAPRWEAAVDASLAQIRTEAERRVRR